MYVATIYLYNIYYSAIFFFHLIWCTAFFSSIFMLTSPFVSNARQAYHTEIYRCVMCAYMYTCTYGVCIHFLCYSLYFSDITLFMSMCVGECVFVCLKVTIVFDFFFRKPLVCDYWFGWLQACIHYQSLWVRNCARVCLSIWLVDKLVGWLAACVWLLVWCVDSYCKF